MFEYVYAYVSVCVCDHNIMATKPARLATQLSDAQVAAAMIITFTFYHTIHLATRGFTVQRLRGCTIHGL